MPCLQAIAAALIAAQAEAPLPQGVHAEWDLAKAFREKTPTRERVCLNGLWRWQPARDPAESVPDARWGFFKVPGFWPGGSRYDLEDTQTLHPHPAWKNENIRSVTAAWYQRAFTVPGDWAGRRIALHADAVNSLAVVFVDGKKLGEIRFPAGELDLTAACRPGATHTLSLLVVALPLKGVMLSYSDTNAAREVRGTVDRRGLCGDIWLVSAPPGARIADVRIETSVRKGEIALDVALENLDPAEPYVLKAEILENGKPVRTLPSRLFKAADLVEGRLTLADAWKPGKLWDTHTPGHQLEARVSLADLDAALPVRFGFREFRIDGRDFYLNGSRIFLSAVPLDNAQLGARAAGYDGARKTLERLKGFGVNLVYTHNYGCEPGTHVGFGEILRAADDVGMLVAFSQPHFGQYDWKAPDADRANGYARHAEPYVRAAQNHPSVVAYVMSHNATGYGEDMNPDQLAAAGDPRGDPWSRNNAALALRAEAIVRRLDPGRIVYHHSSGNLGSMHTINFYANFVPVQEMSDWFETWAARGTKPVFPVEYGVPSTWDWAMYRGWYQGKREFGSAKVPWEFCTSEWNAQFLGDAAFRISEREKAGLRWEAAKFRAGENWQRWDYPRLAAIDDFEERHAVMALYIADNLRAHRAWGVSAINAAWHYQAFWRLRDGADRGRKELKVDWENLQRPGFSADYVARRSWPTDADYDPADWVPTAAGEALLRCNRPLLGFIAGGPERHTSKDHIYRAGETVEKQLIVINNSREAVTCEAEWSLGTAGGRKNVTVGPGRQERIAVRAAVANGELAATFRFPGETQKDALAIHVLPAPPPAPTARIALFDPKGETARLLADLGVRAQLVEASSDLSGFDLLVVGKEALSVDGAAPDVSGLRVVVFEQTAKVMEERFGFRVAEYGLRTVFPRVADHPALAGLAPEHLRDWRGEATVLPPRLSYTMRPRHGPTVRWCGIEVTRLWRCGNRGNVASVLLEKPARGDFLPIVDGGFGLQYSPLMEYREGRGMILFCQLDVTGRTARDPAAERLVLNLLTHASTWKSGVARKAVYVGDSAGKKHLEAAGISVDAYAPGKLAAETALIAGPGAEAEAVREWVRSGGRALVIGAEGDALLPFKLELRKQEHIATHFDPPVAGSLLAGVGPADLHNRDPRELLLVTGGARPVGNGVLAVAPDAAVVLCQLVPWQFDPAKSMNLKRTFRRASRAVTRLASNLGIASSTPLLDRFRRPVDPSKAEKRWLEGLYLDAPEEWDDPYRFFRW